VLDRDLFLATRSLSEDRGLCEGISLVTNASKIIAKFLSVSLISRKG